MRTRSRAALSAFLTLASCIWLVPYEARADTATLGNYPHLITVDPNGHGDFTTLDCALKKIRSLAHPTLCGEGNCTIPSTTVNTACTSLPVDYEECGIDHTTETCDAISILNPFTIYLAPGVHIAEYVDTTGMKGLSIIGMGGAQATHLRVATPEEGGGYTSVFSLDNTDLKIEGVTIGGTVPAAGEAGHNAYPPIMRTTASSPIGPVNLLINNCHFNGDYGAIYWYQRYAGDNLEVMNSLVEYTPNMDKYSLAYLQEAPDMTRITGCTFRNRGNGYEGSTHADILYVSKTTSGQRVVEFSGNTVLLTEGGIANNIGAGIAFSMIDLNSDSNDADLAFYGTGNSFYVDTTSGSAYSVTQYNMFRIGRSEHVGTVKAYLTGNTLSLKTNSGVSAAGVKVEGLGQAYLSGNDISVESGGGGGTWARGIWTDGSAASATLVGNRIETANGAANNDLYQANSSTLTSMFNITSTSSGTIGGNGSNCSSGQAARGVDSLGNAEGCFAVSTPNNGTNCSSGQAAQGVDASGNAESCFAVSTPSSSDTFTNKAYDAAGTGNVLTHKETKELFVARQCNAGVQGGPMDWGTPTSGGPSFQCIVGTNVYKPSLDFADAGATNTAYANVLLPADISCAAGITLELVAMTTATSGSWKWSASSSFTPVDGTATDDPSYNTAATATDSAPAAANKPKTSILSLDTTNCAGNAYLHIKLVRDPSDGSDTIGATLKLLITRLSYTRAE